MAPWISPGGPDTWLDKRDGEIINTATLVERYGVRLPLFGLESAAIAPWYEACCRRLRVHVIEVDRLVPRETPPESRYSRHRQERWTVDVQAADLRR